MALTPLKAEAEAGPLLIDPAVVQNMGLRTAPVEQAPLLRTIRAFGALVEPEPGRRDVSLRSGGYVERLYAGTEGMAIAQGDPLLDVYSPELLVAIEELIGARRLLGGAAGGDAQALYDAAFQKLELQGLAREQVEELQSLERAPRTVTLRSPAAGFLVEKRVNAGSYAPAGEVLLRIADLSRLWLDARVFDADLPHVSLGQRALVTIDGAGGAPRAASVVLIQPRIDPATRSATVRLELDNADLALRSGMYATALFEVEVAPQALVVPREAVIDTGLRQLAFVALGGGRFEPREVALGEEGDGGRVQVLSGLAAGEELVVSGQFLLDAESRTREAVGRFLGAPGAHAGHGAGGGQH
jgi:Cu(I)/Ag(I) efflux system membrane fusion protein/cobalt-zinc-cadmium efflux system membrane fusion protein